MKFVININKPVGMTPLEAIHAFKEKNPHYRGKKMSYPGRLDPMAEGALILLVDEENKKMTQYMKLDKEYEAEILFGIETDSHDILGMPRKNGPVEINERALKKKIKSFVGDYDQEAPVYSSIRVKGKALLNYARRGTLEGLTIPKFTVTIKKIVIDGTYTISAVRLLKEIIRKIDLVQGDFRQEMIKNAWRLLLENSEEKYAAAKIIVSCTSGMYIRALARDVGKDFGGGMLMSLKRTRVGKYYIRESERLR
ncbi:hypothetical protein J4456_03855 [Candidatus Pacearchaeota archaeon]|nr:hypothetical protein [Candidatus Pacearchaeota archaeon]